MKRRLALAWLLLGAALLLLPFAVSLTTSASDVLNGITAGDKQKKPPSIQSAPSMTFTVLNNNDTGAGSLRDAIDQANMTLGADVIDFASALGTINVGSTSGGLPLPDITEAVTIDSGAQRVELNGQATTGGNGNGLTLFAVGVTVRGLAINRFINGDGIRIEAPNCIIQNNFIGTDKSGTTALANTRGVVVNASGNLIGGTLSNEGNLISGNQGSGIALLPNKGLGNNTIQGNLIGTDVSGVLALANGTGVRVDADNTSIGGTSAGAGNIIAFNTGRGVYIFNGINNRILGNSIFSNGALGIDIESGDADVTPNDICDVDVGANNLQNFPVLTSATIGGGTMISGQLESTANTAFRVEFFANSTCDPLFNGEGRTFIGATTITTPPVGCIAPINVTFPVVCLPGDQITATATDPANNTSEFSACVTVVAGSGSDLQITSSDSPDPVLGGSNITYSITVANNGPDPDAGVTFIDGIPTGTTFVSLLSPGSCTTPPVGGTGTVTCNLGALSSGGSASITLVVNVNAPPGSTIANTATVSGMSGDSNLTNNTVITATAVTSTECSLTCPSDLITFTPATGSSCGRVVTFAPLSSGCDTVTCSPPSGAFFAVGSTTVTCSIVEGPSCSFNVIVIDETPPSIACPPGATAVPPPGQTSAVVNYPLPTATDNCGAVNVNCVPPSGSTFPLGTTTVACTARDSFENVNRCFFFVTVLDGEPPVIRCPANVNAALAAGQTSAVVNYPAPTVTDNLPGTSVVCTPASGTSFPAGVTTVTCTATDSGGNRASCSFAVGVGGPQVRVVIPGNQTALAFSGDPVRKIKPKNTPCTFFSIQNVGFAPLILTLDSITRTGTAVDSGRITDPNDTRFFSVSLDNANQLVAIDIGGVVTIQPGGTQSLCAKFAALVPALAGKTTGLAASNVLPDTVTSRIVFRQNAGANVSIPISARVSTGLVLINPSNPRVPAEVVFTRSGNDITVSYAVFDSNLDVTRAKYEFLNSGGQVVAGPFEIDLTASISQANLLKGQSFSVEQRFTGASSNPEATAVRLTVFDGETSVAQSSAASVTSISAAGIELMNRTRQVRLYPPVVRFAPQIP